MTEQDRDEWCRLAEAATPGPWVIGPNADWWGRSEGDCIVSGQADDAPPVCATNDDGVVTITEVANAAYIAHSSPDRVLALLEEVARLKAEMHDSRIDAVIRAEQAEARIHTLEAAIRAHRAAWENSGSLVPLLDASGELWALVPEEPA